MLLILIAGFFAWLIPYRRRKKMQELKTKIC